MWAFSVHHFDQRIDDQRVEAAQRGVFTHKQMRFRAQAVNHASEFYSDITRAHNGNAFRQGRQLKETVGVDTVFRTRDRRMARTTAGRDQDMIRSDRLAIHFNGFRINKTGEATDHIDVVLTQHVVVGGVDSVNIRSAAGDQAIPVEVIDSGVKTIIRAIEMDGLTDLRCMPHHFFRYTTDVDAGAAEVFCFNQCALLAIHGRTVNRGDAAAAAADRDVIIMLSHGLILNR